MTVQAVYTLHRLAEIWGVKYSTLYDWIKRERKAGRGPTPAQFLVKLDLAAGRKVFILRADYASKIQDRYVFRVYSKRRLRPHGRPMKEHA